MNRTTSISSRTLTNQKVHCWLFSRSVLGPLLIAGLLYASSGAFVSISTAAPVTYAYDSLNRLTNVNYGNGSVISYTYDSAGNRLSYSGVVSSVPGTITNIVFTETGNRNTIDSTKWTTSGNTVVESGGAMQVLQSATDAGGNLNSEPIPVNSTGKITITRQVKVHYGNAYYMAEFGIAIGSLPMFTIRYANMSYADGVTYKSCYGFYLTSTNGRPDVISSSANVSTPIPPIWDTWFTEKVTYDPSTGFMEYFVNNVSQLNYKVGALPPANSQNMVLYFSSWGWWTGHEQIFSNLVISQVFPGSAAVPAITIANPTSGPSYTNASATINLSGTTYDSLPVNSVTWSNNRGGSGYASGTTSWNIFGVPLQNGLNTISVNAVNSIGNSNTATLTVISGPITSPVIAITNPSSVPINVASSTVHLSGTASDNLGVALVTWTNNLGASDICSGTTNWFTSDIPLQPGTNFISIAAYNTLGISTVRTLTVVTINPPPIARIAHFLLQNETLSCDINGAPGTIYIVESSTNLINWTSISTNQILSNGRLTLTNLAIINRSQVFYRASTFVLDFSVYQFYNFITNNNKITVTGYTGSNAIVFIPDNFYGMPVDNIAANAFSDNSQISSVTIPNTLTDIGETAFYDCLNLTNITIPDSVTNIAYGAFAQTSLFSITIPASVTFMDLDVFWNCQNLQNLYFEGDNPGVTDDYFAGNPFFNLYTHAGSNGWMSNINWGKRIYLPNANMLLF